MVTRASPTPFAYRGHVKSPAEYIYTETQVFLLQERSYKDSVGQRPSAREYEAVSCVKLVPFVRGREKLGFW